MPLYLNPGLTFGTGSHATTQLCLELLEEAVRPGCQVLDLGCGSGILAIAALGLGAAHAIGVDIDPKAVDVAYENAAMNGIGPDRLTVYAGNVLGDAKLAAKLRPGQNRVVLANIVADVIIPCPPRWSSSWLRMGCSWPPVLSTTGRMRWLPPSRPTAWPSPAGWNVRAGAPSRPSGGKRKPRQSTKRVKNRDSCDGRR